MCWGDGRAKRNRRVSWLITCEEARAVSTCGRAAPSPHSGRVSRHPEGTLMSRVDVQRVHARVHRHGVKHAPRVPLLSLAQRRAGPPSKGIRVGNELRIPTGGCQMAQKILRARGRIQPCHQLGQGPGVAGRPRALGWQTKGRAETRPVC